MAKWGEGDPRWIVEERADATNVNNWHWTERDVTQWSEMLLKELLLAVKVEGAQGVCEVTEVTRIEGEASCNNRKGKLIVFYEWDIGLAWKGTSKTGVKYNGIVNIPNLSEENDVDDIDVSVSLKSGEPDTDLLQLMRKAGEAGIRKALAAYMSKVKSEFTQGMILPAKDGAPAEKDNGVQAPKLKLDPVKKQGADGGGSIPKGPGNGGKFETCRVSLSESFSTSPMDLFQVFVRQELVQAFTRAPAEVDPKPGGKFSLLNGNVSGYYVQLVPNERIVMKWRYRTWPAEHHADVTLVLTDKGVETELALCCEGVPTNEEELTRDGWRRYYFEGIKMTFGYGARLY